MNAIQSTLYEQAEALRNMANARHLTDEVRHALRVAEGLMTGLSVGITWEGSLSRNDAHDLMLCLIEATSSDPQIGQRLEAAKARQPLPRGR